jgi:hypothetical protein
MHREDWIDQPGANLGTFLKNVTDYINNCKKV